MSLTRKNLREKLAPGGGEPAEELVDALDGMIESGEQIEYRLPGKGALVREESGETEKIPVPAGGTSFAVVTDRKLCFVLASPGDGTQIEIAYTEIKSVDAHDGLLRSKLTVAVWGRGEYRLKIADTTDLGAAVQYLRESSDCWDKVIASLEDAHERSTEMAAELEDGRIDLARENREASTAKIDRARQYLDRAEIDPPAALLARVESAEDERDRMEIRARIARAETLLTEATHLTNAREYTEAYRNFWYARDHLETALSVARESDVPEPPEITAKLETIETRLAHLEVRPRALAQQACERAEGTDKLAVEVDAWADAFEHYRDALTAGWGTPLEFSGDTEELRFRIESVVGQLIAKRQALATDLEREGDEHRRGHPDTAIERYDEALDQLEAALQLAREFRSGDPERIETKRDRLGRKRYELADN